MSGGAAVLIYVTIESESVSMRMTATAHRQLAVCTTGRPLIILISRCSVRKHWWLRVEVSTEVEVRVVEQHSQVVRALHFFELDRMHVALYVVALRKEASVMLVFLSQPRVHDF